MNNGTPKTTIRPAVLTDLPDLKEVIDSNGLFPSEMLDEMMHPFFTLSDSGEFWFIYEHDSIPIGVTYCAPERLTDGTFNLYLIAIQKRFHGLGIGSAMMEHIENVLLEKGHRVLIVETSGLDEFALTRKFYLKRNYTLEARIRDFYKEGEDKVIFWKKLL